MQYMEYVGYSLGNTSSFAIVFHQIFERTNQSLRPVNVGPSITIEGNKAHKPEDG